MIFSCIKQLNNFSPLAPHSFSQLGKRQIYIIKHKTSSTIVTPLNMSLLCATSNVWILFYFYFVFSSPVQVKIKLSATLVLLSQNNNHFSMLLNVYTETLIASLNFFKMKLKTIFLL